MTCAERTKAGRKMLVVPPAVCAAAVALADARQGVVKVEHGLAQVLPRFVDHRGHPC
jgi:hypothetical protein